MTRHVLLHFTVQVLQDCFEKKDIPMLQDALGEMPEEEARYHLKRCVDSGLWIPNAKEAEEQAAGGDAPPPAAGGDTEDEYATVGEAHPAGK